MKSKHLKELKNNTSLQTRLAKVMVGRCFLPMVKELGVGRSPASAKRNFSDVKVVMPSGEIPWKALARLSKRESDVLVGDAVLRCYRFMTMLFGTPEGERLIELLLTDDMCSSLDDPQETP